VADAGWLVTRVVRVQPRPADELTYLVADAGMTELIRPMLYGAIHPVSLVSPGLPLDAASEVHLAGPVCEAGDILARNLDRSLSPEELAGAGTGALLAIGRAGAYGAAMASVYNGRLRPAEVVLEDGEPRASRRRETLDDLLVRDIG
jgi:diaminopimelate decarboxylase